MGRGISCLLAVACLHLIVYVSRRVANKIRIKIKSLWYPILKFCNIDIDSWYSILMQENQRYHVVWGATGTMLRSFHQIIVNNKICELMHFLSFLNNYLSSTRRSLTVPLRYFITVMNDTFMRFSLERIEWEICHQLHMYLERVMWQKCSQLLEVNVGDVLKCVSKFRPWLPREY